MNTVQVPGDYGSLNSIRAFLSGCETAAGFDPSDKWVSLTPAQVECLLIRQDDLDNWVATLASRGYLGFCMAVGGEGR